MTGLLAAGGWGPFSAQGAEVSEADKRVVQTVQRLGSFDYGKASQKTKEAINRYLTATAGEAEYFAMVEKFGAVEQADTLLKLAVAGTGTAKSGEAVKLLLKLGQQEAVRKTLAGLEPESAAALLESMASVGSQEAVSLVMESVSGSASAATGPPAGTTPGTAPASAPASAPVSGLLKDEVRIRAVKSLGQNAAGQKALLAAAKTGSLPEAVKEAAATALTTSTDETVRTEAAALFQMAARKPLPPVAELAKRTGDAGKGETVYMSYCFTCHQVNGVGIDFGPALSEIGSKLAKEALYDSILHPSAGISFGYEGFEVKTKTGETFIGMVASETADELSLKVPGGVLQKTAKTNVESKTPLGVSLMTPGLENVMEEQQLVDLVEYLAGLKARGKS